MIRKYNGINLRIPGSGQDSGFDPTSGAITIMGSVNITANTFIVGDCIKIRTTFSKPNSFSTTYDIRLHWSPNGALSGATQLALFSSISTDISPSLYRTMTFKTSNQAFIYSTGATSVEDIGPGISGTTLSGIDITSTGYIIASAQRTSGASRSYDLITMNYLSTEV